MAEKLKGRFITIKGRHIFIPEGKSVAQTINEKFGAKGREDRLTKSTIAKGEKVNYNDRQDIDDEQRQARRDYWQTREKARAQAKKNYETKIKGRAKTTSEKKADSWDKMFNSMNELYKQRQARAMEIVKAKSTADKPYPYTWALKDAEKEFETKYAKNHQYMRKIIYFLPNIVIK